MSAPHIVVLSPAKLNLVLRVLGRRPDGYHDLSMLNLAVDLYDRVEIGVAEHEGVRLSCNHPGVPSGPENLAVMAAEKLFNEYPGSRVGLDISIEKKVPVAGGLGGGSGNAAAVLWGLSRLLRIELPPGRLLELALELGSDVPFFLFRSPAWAWGRGEKLEDAAGELPAVFVVVGFPFGLSTGEIFRTYDLTRPYDGSKVENLGGTGVIPPPRDWENDLEAVSVALRGEIAVVRNSLEEMGALAARMSGSGPTVFGVFSDDASALRARDYVGSVHGLAGVVCRPVRGGVLQATT